MNTGILLWIDADGTAKWDVYSSANELNAILKTLFDQNVDPAKMMLAGDMLSWPFPSLHQKRQTVRRSDLLRIKQNDIVGVQKPQTSEVVERINLGKKELGWISPEGEFFPCGYGCHTEKAREIVGNLALSDDVDDASRYLEDSGWLAVYKNPMPGKSLAIGMGRTLKHISNQQLQALQRLGIDCKIENISKFL